MSGGDSQSSMVVVSPLVSLMKDQERAVGEKDVRAVYAGD